MTIIVYFVKRSSKSRLVLSNTNKVSFYYKLLVNYDDLTKVLTFGLCVCACKREREREKERERERKRKKEIQIESKY